MKTRQSKTEHLHIKKLLFTAILLLFSLSIQAATTFTLSLAPVGPITALINTNIAYTATLKETGTTASAGTITLTSTLPVGMTFISGGAGTTGFACTYTAATRVVSCTRTTSLAVNASVAVPLTLSGTAVTTTANSVSFSVSGGGSVGSVTSNVVATNILNRPDVSVSLSQPAPTFIQKAMSLITLTVSNAAGTSVALAPIKASFTLPANFSTPLKFSQISDHWVCTRAAQVVSCSYDLNLAPGSLTNLRIPVTPSAAIAVGSVITTPFIGSVTAVANETNTANNGPVNLMPTAAVKALALVADTNPATIASYSYPILDANTITMYNTPLPNPLASFFKRTATSLTVGTTIYDTYNVGVRRVTSQILPPGFPATTVYAYGDPAVANTFTYPAHTIEARSTNTVTGKPVRVTYTNSLLSATLPHLLPVDHSIHGAMAGRPVNPFLPYQPDPLLPNYNPNSPGVLEPDIRTVAHLHGAQVINEINDGYPEAWHSPSGQNGTGPAGQTVAYNPNPFDYTNQQESTMLWYHDHTLAMTRLNVFAGLAGLYVLRDDNEVNLINTNQIPSGRYEIPLVLQDRMFKLDGSFAYPDKDPNTGLGNTLNPSTVPEFFGNVMMVNGAAWPYLQVEPKKYRFRILNGSNARFYTVEFKYTDTSVIPSQDYYVPFQVIASDGGFLSAPQPATVSAPSIFPTVSPLTIAPAERYDVIVDFTGLTGKNIVMTNSARTPFGRTVNCTGTAPPSCIKPGVAPSGMQAEIMQFKVNAPNMASPVITIPATLRAAITTTPIVNRQVLLGEKTDMFGRINPILGTPTLGFQDWLKPVSEQPVTGTVEKWEIFNSTMDAHPVHLHDGVFQAIERQPFSAILGANGKLTNICYSSTPRLPKDPTTGVIPACPTPTAASPTLSIEKGWKDTIIAYPSENNIPTLNLGGIVKGQVTRVNMKFSGPGLFVWHCHIIDHEDHDMMRPMRVLP